VRLNNNDYSASETLAKTTPVPAPESHSSCMVCGKNNPIGITFTPQGDSVIAVFQAKPQWQGYSGLLHGGMISTLLDAAMTHCLFHHGIEAMTASLKVRFLEPVPCTGMLKVKATLGDQRRHVYLLKAELAASGRCLARAEARFIRSRKS
jgi:acyl-coenzyme A thioesterase PaaI-like protein